MSFKFNPFTGQFDQVGGSASFSYYYVVTGSSLTIPIYQQMVVVDDMHVDGTLTINGSLAVING